jgi:hypothetical protein
MRSHCFTPFRDAVRRLRGGVACGGSVHATAGPDASGSTNAPDASADSTVNFGADADADDGAPPGDAADLQDARFLVAPPDAEAGLPYCNSLACFVPTGCTTNPERHRVRPRRTQPPLQRGGLRPDGPERHSVADCDGCEVVYQLWRVDRRLPRDRGHRCRRPLHDYGRARDDPCPLRRASRQVAAGSVPPAGHRMRGQRRAARVESAPPQPLRGGILHSWLLSRAVATTLDVS